MEHVRLFLYFALAIVGFMLWNAWMHDYPPATTTSTAVQNQTLVPQALTEKVSQTQPPSTTSPSPVKLPTPAVTDSEQLIAVMTNVLNLKIDVRGGNIVRLSLPKYPKSVDTPHVPFQLLSDDPEYFYVSQSGLTGPQGPDTQLGQVTYTTKSWKYQLTPEDNQLVVDLHWQNGKGLAVTKEFIFNHDSYVIEIRYIVKNQSNEPWVGNFYGQIQNKIQPSPGIFQLHTFQGPAISSPEKPYEKMSCSQLYKEALGRNVEGGWLAFQQRYFLTVWVPPQNQINHFYGHSSADICTLGFLSPQLTAPKQSSVTTSAKFYAGPEIAEHLKGLAPHLDLTIDFGWLWFLAMPILWLLRKIYAIVGNWGWSIVLVTLVIKLLMYKLSEKTYRSMAKMRDLQPRLAALKERYGDDRQKLGQATIEFYKKEKVNPLSSCLPMILQIPVFIALLYVLTESIELRQAFFILWIKDLSVRDPYYILPILMGLSMYLQQLLSPAPPDPAQAKLMRLLPIGMTFFFMAFPAGLVLYWLTNNVLSALQQWLIIKSYEKAEAKRKRGKK